MERSLGAGERSRTARSGRVSPPAGAPPSRVAPAGFTKREESEYDPFGAGHSSTSISAGLGMAVGRDFKGKKNQVGRPRGSPQQLAARALAGVLNAPVRPECQDEACSFPAARLSRCFLQVIAVIGDGAITGGMAYEAMNHAGFLDKNMIVILNDNQQARAPRGQGCVARGASGGPPAAEPCRAVRCAPCLLPSPQVSLPTQYNNKNQDPVGALSSALARLQVRWAQPRGVWRTGAGTGRGTTATWLATLGGTLACAAGEHRRKRCCVLLPQANRPLRELREIAKGVTKQLPDVVQRATAKIDE